jgi:hypothetical protein
MMILNLRPYGELPDRCIGASSFWYNEPAIYGKQLMSELQQADIDEKLSKDYLWQQIIKVRLNNINGCIVVYVVHMCPPYRIQ